jgi:ubiquinone/menaquinone biosynthesis C-methylase UbiE
LGAKHLTGFDLSAGSLQIAAYHRPGQAFAQASLTALPYADASFDIVWLWGVLHYVPNTPLAVAELSRVLRPGGQAVIHTLRRTKWAQAEAALAQVLSRLPRPLQAGLLTLLMLILPPVIRLVSGRAPAQQTAKTLRQKLHERLFAPAQLALFTLAQLTQYFGAGHQLEEIHPPVSDLLKRNTSLTVMVRKAANPL